MRRLVIIPLLFLPLIASATNFVAVGGGNWQSNLTWGTASGGGCHVTYPCMTDAGNAGDTADIHGNIITIPASEVDSIGASNTTASSCTAGTAALVNSTGTGGLILNGTLIFAGAVCFDRGSLSYGAAATLQHDNSWQATATNYTFVLASSSTQRGQWVSTSASNLTFNGDSFFSTLKKSGVCTSANTSTCLSGALCRGASLLEDCKGTLWNFTLQNVGGTTQGSSLTSMAINVVSGGNVVFNNLVVLNSAYVYLNAANGTSTLTINGLRLTNGTNTSTSQGCLQLNVSGTGIATISNFIIGCPVVNATLAATGFTLLNGICSADEAGGFFTAGSTNLRPCWIGNDSSFFDQVLFYADTWNTTTTENGGAKGSMGTRNIQNSVLWTPKNINSTAGHIHASAQSWQGILGGAWQHHNNAFGSFGDVETAATEAHQAGNPDNGNPTSATTIVCSNNVNLCGAYGRSSLTANCTFLSTGIPTNVAADAVSVFQNDYCSSAVSLATANAGDGMPAAEAGTPTSQMVNVEANTFFRVDLSGGLGQGAVPEVFDQTANAAYNCNGGGGTCPWHNIKFNVVAGHNSTQGTNPPGGTAANGGLTWTVNGPSSATEIIQTNTLIGKIDPWRSVPLFSEYLQNSGLFTYTPTNQYASATTYLNGTTCTTNYKGAWATSTAYSVCDVVFVDATVTGYSTVYGGRKTLWVCKEAHTSGSTNQPIIASDTSNPYQTPDRFWEEAWIGLWLKPNILTGKVFNDGSLPPLYQPTNGNMYAVGLLDAWIHQGFINMDWALWNGRTAAPWCSTNGTTGVECGAVPLANIQHTAANAAFSF